MLYHAEPIFREHLDRCLHLARAARRSRSPPGALSSPEETAEASQALNRPSLALPALFAVEYALAQLWMAWGVRPQAMIGHSLGEYVAACLAGVVSIEDALALVALRGHLLEKLPTGAMLSVALSEERVGAAARRRSLACGDQRAVALRRLGADRSHRKP